jgi:hypothetical protein
MHDVNQKERKKKKETAYEQIIHEFDVLTSACHRKPDGMVDQYPENSQSTWEEIFEFYQSSRAVEIQLEMQRLFNGMRKKKQTVDELSLDVLSFMFLSVMFVLRRHDVKCFKGISDQKIIRLIEVYLAPAYQKLQETECDG